MSFSLFSILWCFAVCELRWKTDNSLLLVETSDGPVYPGRKLVARPGAVVLKSLDGKHVIKHIHNCLHAMSSEFSLAQFVSDSGGPVPRVVWVGESAASIGNFGFKQKNMCNGRVLTMVQEFAPLAPPTPENAVLAIEALERLHALEIVHGDLHWGNIVMLPPGVGFIDFGLALDTQHVPEWAPWTAPMFSSPNHLAGEPKSFSDDLFRLFEELANKMSFFAYQRLLAKTRVADLSTFKSNFFINHAILGPIFTHLATGMYIQDFTYSWIMRMLAPLHPPSVLEYIQRSTKRVDPTSKRKTQRRKKLK